MRPCGLTAPFRGSSRFARLASTSVPGHACGFHSGLFCLCQNEPAAPSACVSAPAACLLVSAKPRVKTHTHEDGSISSGWPPNQPASRIAKLFGEGGGRGEGRPVRWGVRVLQTPCPENSCAQQAGGCAVPDPGRFGDPDFRPCHHTHVVVQQSISGEPKWPTIKRTPMRPSSFSA